MSLSICTAPLDTIQVLETFQSCLPAFISVDIHKSESGVNWELARSRFREFPSPMTSYWAQEPLYIKTLISQEPMLEYQQSASPDQKIFRLSLNLPFMKKLLPFLLLFPTLLFAQQRSSAPDQESRMRVKELSSSAVRITNDTLRATSFTQPCGNTVLTYINTSNWGYVAGTNGFGDKEKAERLSYSTTSPIEILEVWGFFAVAEPVGDGTVQFNLYDTFTDGGPNTLIGSTTNSRVSGLGTTDSAIVATIFPVLGNVTLTGESSFLASLDISAIYATNDTVALFSTEAPCGDTTTSWELFSDDTWANMSDGGVTWGLQIDLYIAAVISFDETSSIEDGFSMDGLTIHPVYPSPAAHEINVPFELTTQDLIAVRLMDLNGRVVYQQAAQSFSPGEHEVAIDVSRLPAGVYTCLIETSEGALGSRIVVE